MAKIKKRSLAAFAAAVLLSAEPALGFDISYDGGENDFHLKGSTDLKKAGQIITLKVTDENDGLLFTRQTETSQSGEWEFVFAVDYNGSITATVSENGVLTPKVLYKSTETEVNTALSRLNGSENINTVITDEADVLQIDITEYNSFASSGLLDKVMDSGSYTSVSDVKKAYNLGKFLVTVEKAGSAADILAAENTYPETAEYANTAAGEIYSTYSDAEKQAVLSGLCGKTFESMEKYAKERDEAVIFNEIKNASNYNEKYKIVEDNNDILGLDLAKYANLGSKLESFKQALFAKSNTDVKTLKENAEAAYSEVTYVPPSGGGGGGSRGGSTVKADNSLVTPQKMQSIKQFDDLEGYDWAKTAISVLAAKDVINGKAEGVFAPADNVTRAEFVKILAGAFGLSGNAEVAFDDVPVGHWAYDFVSAGVANGITKGVSDNLFGANDNITRQDMAAICGRLMDMLGVTVEGEDVFFADESEISEYAAAEVKKLAKAGIINGVGEDKFAPKNNATRAQAAVIIYKLSEYCSGR